MEGDQMVRGNIYRFKYQPEADPPALRYLGINWSGLWHQFEKVDEPGKVWAEVGLTDLWMIEPVKEPHNEND